MVEALVMIVNGDREHLLGMVCVPRTPALLIT
jgi:hypothetical protein